MFRSALFQARVGTWRDPYQMFTSCITAIYESIQSHNLQQRIVVNQTQWPELHRKGF
jgi:hypothetical protein